MKVVDLTEEHEPLYFVCLEEWSEEMQEAGDHKRRWYERMKERGLGVKLALDDSGVVAGMIQYAPIEHTFVKGDGLYLIYCVWVHGHRKGRGNFQKRGMGKALLHAAEEDARARGARGMAAWGLALPFWMKASWFKKHGYRRADRLGMATLVWKPFVDDAIAPRWVRPKQKPTARSSPGKVTVTAFCSGWCPAQNLVFERAQRAASELGERVVFQPMDTFNRETFLAWGISDGLFIENREVSTGPPPSYDKVKKMIAQRVRKLR